MLQQIDVDLGGGFVLGKLNRSLEFFPKAFTRVKTLLRSVYFWCVGKGGTTRGQGCPHIIFSVLGPRKQHKTHNSLYCEIFLLSVGRPGTARNLLIFLLLPPLAFSGLCLCWPLFQNTRIFLEFGKGISTTFLWEHKNWFPNLTHMIWLDLLPPII